MALSSRATAEQHFQGSKRWKHREISPERNMVWTEPKPKSSSGNRRVPVVYYLCRNGHLDHPHFMEVPLSSNDGLYLKDVINRLDVLRGKGMASLYSWSSKRSYKNGFVWHDLSENDFIYPAHGREYVLKGSEILDPGLITNPRSLLATASFRSLRPPEPAIGEDFLVTSRRRNQSWSSIDLSEYKVYKSESSSDSNRRFAADASTQTDDRQRRRTSVKNDEVDEREGEREKGPPEASCVGRTTELSQGEISPPPSDSSSETLENLMKADGRVVLRQSESEGEGGIRTAESFPSGRMKASTVLMQLISCGSLSLRDCGPSLAKDQELSSTAGENAKHTKKEIRESQGVNVEDKEYFSGSLIETKRDIVPTLKRSSSYNADRSSGRGESRAWDEEGIRGKCIPRKSRQEELS